MPTAGPTTERVHRTSLVDELEARLRTEIVDGDYPPGTLLPPERELAERYGVTRTTVKHTLVRLAQMGLISTRHGVGSEVRDWRRTGGAELLPLLADATTGGADPAAVFADVVEARTVIGAEMAALAATRIDRAGAARLRECLDRVTTAPDPVRRQDADLELHRELARVAGNSVFVLMTNTLFAAYEPWRARFVDAYADGDALTALLRPLVDAVCDGDAAAARDAATAFLTTSGRLLRELVPTSRPTNRSRRQEHTR